MSSTEPQRNPMTTSPWYSPRPRNRPDVEPGTAEIAVTEV
jgi:hypothetical protein